MHLGTFCKNKINDWRGEIKVKLHNMITGAIISLTDLGHATSYKAMNCLNGFGQEA